MGYRILRISSTGTSLLLKGHLPWVLFKDPCRDWGQLSLPDLFPSSGKTPLLGSYLGKYLGSWNYLITCSPPPAFY